MTSATSLLRPTVTGPDLALARRFGRFELRAPDGALIGEFEDAVDAWQAVDAIDLAEAGADAAMGRAA